MTEMQDAPLLIASDVDGTLINESERIVPRVRSVITRATRAGTVMALATGRPPRWIFPVLDQLPVRPVCVCANGAVLYDSAYDRVLKAHTLSPEVMAEIAATAKAHFPGVPVGIAVERAGRSAFDREGELFQVSPEYLHTWAATDHGVAPVEALVAEPAIKLLVRNAGLTSEELFRELRPLIPRERAHITYSVSEGLLEIMAPGVNKATGVQDLAQLIGARRDQVVCFGDMPNDVEMLEWAGLGVAMGNGVAAVKAVADEITGTNNDGGLADILERWF